MDYLLITLQESVQTVSEVLPIDVPGKTVDTVSIRENILHAWFPSSHCF